LRKNKISIVILIILLFDVSISVLAGEDETILFTDAEKDMYEITPDRLEELGEQNELDLSNGIDLDEFEDVDIQQLENLLLDLENEIYDLDQNYENLSCDILNAKLDRDGNLEITFNNIDLDNSEYTKSIVWDSENSFILFMSEDVNDYMNTKDIEDNWTILIDNDIALMKRIDYDLEDDLEVELSKRIKIITFYYSDEDADLIVFEIAYAEFNFLSAFSYLIMVVIILLIAGIVIYFAWRTYNGK